MNETEPVYGVNCLHGEQECAGNVQELCMAKHRPNSKDWWPFVQCLNRGGYENVGLLNLAKGCAKTVGLDWKSDGVAECVEGEEGPSLLRASVTRTREMDITYVIIFLLFFYISRRSLSRRSRCGGENALTI